MNKIVLILSAISLFGLACHNITDSNQPPLPHNGEINDDGDPLKIANKKKYLEQLYFAAPGTNVDSIRAENRQRNIALKKAQQGAQSRSVGESFANGQLLATWHERGPKNEAGDMRVIDFVPSTEELYAISTVGHLWKGNLNGLTWSLLNDDIQFEPDEIEVLPHNGGKRIFAIYGAGTDDKKIRYSDNEGQTWTTGTGFSFYDHWGRGRRLYTLSDNQTLYYLVHTWSGNPWGELFQLYKSTNKGVSYTKVWDSPVGTAGEDVDLWKAHDSDNMYLVDNRQQKFYAITHNFGTGATTISSPNNYGGQGIPPGEIHLSGRFNNTLNTNEFFLFQNSDRRTYKSTNNGANWALLSTATEDVWVKGWLADPDNNNLYLGGFQLNKSLNGGVSWQEQYPQWWRYYSHSKDSMHVDIMNLEYFKKSNGTSFILILNHAGVYVTYDHFATTANLGLNDLNVVTLYDQSTASDGFVYCGAQDKGTFKFSGNSMANFDQFDTDNMTTGDGMIGVFMNSDQSFFSMIQNGTVACLPDRDVRDSYWYEIPGDNKPGWINPMVPTPNFIDRKAYVAGGNLNGGPGSYLISLAVNIGTNNNVTWLPTQYNYDFRANSDNGISVIKAIGTAQSNHNRLYVATEDATFFSSSNQGSTWTKQNGANLPSTLIPWDIKTSNTDANKVFICGTGFSNTGVYQSTNGGSTFTALSTDIPQATFYEIALSNNEDMLFAATSEGPYVYIFSANRWYSLMGASTPIVDYNTVDNVGNNVIRFGTYGRGIWDFQVNSSLPVELVSFEARKTNNATTLLEWVTGSEINSDYFLVEHSTNGSVFQLLGQVAAKGAPNRTTHYTHPHNNPAQGLNYYRLRMTDTDGNFSFSPIQVVDFETIGKNFTVYPTVVRQFQSVHIVPQNAAPYQVELFHINGQKVKTFEQEGAFTFAAELERGIYVYQIKSEGNRHSGKIIVE